MDYELVNAVKTVVSDSFGVRVRDLSLDTTLFGDLGMDGDDATEFFQRFAEVFEVDLTDLDLSKHFNPEGWGCLLSLPASIRAWQSGDPHSAAGLIPISIRDLTEAAQRKRWIRK